MSVKIARLVIAGLSGDSGKTVVSLSILAALIKRGMTVIPFKKGPDYIDSAWLGSIAGQDCHNLDTWLSDSDAVLKIFTTASKNADLALVEGNRGLFDGKDIEGSHSTAGLAKLLRAPLILVVNVTKATRTIAALVKGCQLFDPDLKTAGVILNKVAGERHRKIITETIEKYCSLPVLGCLPRLGEDAKIIPGRHLGLVPPAEFESNNDLADRLSSIAENNINLDKVLDIASQVTPLPAVAKNDEEVGTAKVKIGYFKDSVFTFYYPENLAALRREGAQLIPINSLSDRKLPDIDCLYIGGGFPETQAEKLSQNLALKDSVRKAAESGLPIYAECGGLIYLCRSLSWRGQEYPMAGIFAVNLSMQNRPAGHGYTQLKVDRANPYFPAGMVIRGHEFHYSAPVSESIPDSCFQVETGVGFGNKRDGLIYNNVLAAYTHIHAAGAKGWAKAMIALAHRFAESRKTHSDGINLQTNAFNGAALA